MWGIAANSGCIIGIAGAGLASTVAEVIAFIIFVIYIFQDKYLLEANGRYDGTSRFPKDDRFGFFPSFSAGWRISEENFMTGTRGIVDNLKIRASYGTLGNQLLGSNYYPY